MGRKSVKENKNVYQLKREELGLSREQAALQLNGLSEDQIERIENGSRAPHPDEVLALAEGYAAPSLRNFYCTNQCPIGMKHGVVIETSDLPAITLQTLASLNEMEKYKDRFIEISADSVIDDSELEDFRTIRQTLKKIALSVASLRMWVEEVEAKNAVAQK